MAKSMRLKTDDQVMVMSGKDAGKTGRVIRTDPKKRRVYVEHLNMIKRAERPRSASDATRADAGGIVEKEGPIHVSNVMLLDAKGKRTRVAIEREDGKRFRVAKSSGTRLD